MQVRWSGRAVADMIRIAEFNEQRSASWARKIEQRIEARVGSLLDRPDQGRRVGASAVRLLSIPDIPYVISYARNRTMITILRVRSTREIIESR